MIIRTVRATFASIILSVLVFTTLYRPPLFEQQIAEEHKSIIYPALVHTTTNSSPFNSNCAIEEQQQQQDHHLQFFLIISILFPAWEVILLLPPNKLLPPDSTDFFCLYSNNHSSEAIHLGKISSPERQLLRCILPESNRRRQPFPQPNLVGGNSQIGLPSPKSKMLHWNYIVYESLSTEQDLILFVKGINNRQGINKSPTEFRCLFFFDQNRIKTAVTISSQEVFRCNLPMNSNYPATKVTLEMVKSNQLIPSVAYYTPFSKPTSKQTKSLMCACTMVYNVAKFIREWIVYYSAIGVEKFIFYDNGSDDGFEEIVNQLINEGYEIETRFWVWQKTQEAGFSHCAIQFKETCEWMIFVDVDEFIYSPSWINFTNPVKNMISSLLPKSTNIKNREIIAQVMISCYEFGPSNQTEHPEMGITQGYDCRRRMDNRHKSIVLLDAIDDSLLNVVHHFKLREGYIRRKVSLREAVVNHYKYQAWSEFRMKFRRRVSAYVTDWTQSVNPMSKDRTPGLGFDPVEPYGWSQKFCEVYDHRLRNLTWIWFGSKQGSQRF
ncbi:glycosyltransferase family 92 protein RCOM_0530710 [Impatiens glandulifera]|uniref:glycosyltransferase family 92 protein RCOM_0530710 n=1 Tax=Impatiens glandulifera TaxID=253017 RepID=UPI001FB09D2C|nr:glycosyltransferase family 92 protein RCOM_0530710 [Impatiens glandulifera]